MILYYNGIEFDSDEAKEIHGFTLPSGFFDNPEARKHWGISETKEIIINEPITEKVTLTEVLPEEPELILEKETNKKGKHK